MLSFTSGISPGEFLAFLLLLCVFRVYLMVGFTLYVLPGTGCGTPLRKSFVEL